MTLEPIPLAPKNFPIGTSILGDLPTMVLNIGLYKLVEWRYFRSLHNPLRDKGLFFLKKAIMEREKKKRTLEKEL